MTKLRDERAHFYNLVGTANLLEPETELVMLETAKLGKKARGQKARLGSAAGGGGGAGGRMGEESVELRTETRRLEREVSGKVSNSYSDFRGLMRGERLVFNLESFNLESSRPPTRRL